MRQVAAFGIDLFGTLFLYLLEDQLMSFTRLRWAVGLTVAVCSLANGAPSARATALPITFESPTYSPTADPNATTIPGTANGQDGWNGAGFTGVGFIRIASGSAPTAGYVPVDGAQSLLVNNSATGNASTGTRSQVSGSIGGAADISWLVRVDSLGGASGGSGVLSSGAASGRGIEFGLSNLAVAGSTPIAIAFNDDGGLRYITPGTAGYTAFPGNPTYSTGTTYRVELLNINTTLNTFDVSIFNNGTNASIASVTGAFAVNTIFGTTIASPIGGAIGTSDVGFYVARRGSAVGNASVDSITSVPEPGSIVGLCLGAIIVAVHSRHKAMRRANS
jgi:hypothetical protein